MLVQRRCRGCRVLDPIESCIRWRDRDRFFSLAHLFFVEVVGGLGLGLGYLTYFLIRRIDDYQIEEVISLATVMTGTVLAKHLDVSAPLAMVAAGLLVGHERVRDVALSKTSEQYLDGF